jgi:hypothetical protein
MDRREKHSNTRSSSTSYPQYALFRSILRFPSVYRDDIGNTLRWTSEKTLSHIKIDSTAKIIQNS